MKVLTELNGGVHGYRQTGVHISQALPVCKNEIESTIMFDASNREELLSLCDVPGTMYSLARALVSTTDHLIISLTGEPC